MFGNIGNQALVSIDGTDMPVQSMFDSRFCSHKFKSNGLKFEVGVCIQTGDIVWINGSFRCGMADITIARQAVVSALEEGEMAEADGGYRGEPFYTKVPKAASSKSKEEAYMKTVARSRHETANKRLKIYGILKKAFRHDLTKHYVLFSC